jgi:hypothetical protein
VTWYVHHSGAAQQNQVVAILKDHIHR